MQKKFGEDWRSNFGEKLKDRQTHMHIMNKNNAVTDR